MDIIVTRCFKQGLFKPRNPTKYKGNINNIVYRSSWELKMNHFLDNNPNIIKWAAEELVIPYVKPTDGRIHRYFPDYWIKYKNKSGKIIQEVIEVKPKKQTEQPTTRGKSRKTQIYEQLTWAVNIAKWQSATQWCKKNNMTFRIVTELELFK